MTDQSKSGKQVYLGARLFGILAKVGVEKMNKKVILLCHHERQIMKGVKYVTLHHCVDFLWLTRMIKV